MYEINNRIVKAVIASKGAELQSLVSIGDELEYMWSGDDRFWGKKSPVLFPIVGGLKNNIYRYKGKEYNLPRHGFAREREFTVTQQSTESITFTLGQDEESLLVYPFHFRFSISYTLEAHSLRIKYLVENPGQDLMYFSVGAHPAFSVPLIKIDEFSDYYLAFDRQETAGKWPLSNDGLIKTKPVDFLHQTQKLVLQKGLFYGDALVFKDLQSQSISILGNKTGHGLTVGYAGFPYMGIWSAKNADFVCIEPWCGIADSVDTTGNLEEKEGIHSLSPGAQFERHWEIEIF